MEFALHQVYRNSENNRLKIVGISPVHRRLSYSNYASTYAGTYNVSFTIFATTLNNGGYVLLAESDAGSHE